ncbi:MAG: hypothetical protein U0531_11770 [Dehalococcoidia bacterium]
MHLLDAAVFDRVMKVNVYGVLYASSTAARLIEQGTGGSLIASPASTPTRWPRASRPTAPARRRWR